jgi:mevalonate kinase
MITGEYLALAGSLVLAIPLRFGQSLSVDARSSEKGLSITWVAMEQNREWFRDTFRGNEFVPENPSSPISQNLQRLLQEARAMNPAFPDPKGSYHVNTLADFPLEWGLGSSSTLISNLAWWADLDPFDLLFHTSSGSGYDIACARSDKPLLYRFNGKEHKPSVRTVDFDPPFLKNLWFVYTGRKQSSASSIMGIDPASFDAHTLERISELTMKMAREEDLQHFMRMMTAHETVISRAIDRLPLQAARFPDFQGAIKSLGAWGGDFCLAASELDENKVRTYFLQKGCPVVFPFFDMILNNPSANGNN